MKNFLLFLFEIFKVVVISLAIVIPVRYFLFQPFLVKGSSMEPNFHNGDYLIVDEISYRFESPKRGDVIVFHYPRNPSQLFIKRILGLPGETVKIANNTIEVVKPNGRKVMLDESSYLQKEGFRGKEEVKLGDNEYFVLGDNRMNSSDSRFWGPVPRNYIIGRVVLRGWPLYSFGLCQTPSY
ncbi:signal peptidase I [bacterium]|nr:signal peptidase I [bacterium]